MVADGPLGTGLGRGVGGAPGEHVYREASSDEKILEEMGFVVDLVHYGAHNPPTSPNSPQKS